MKLILKIARTIIGNIILFFDFIIPTGRVKRTTNEQAEIDKKTNRLILYQYRACPFCVRVRRAMRRLNLNLEIRDALNNKEYEQQLIEGGGKRKVPCLRITDPHGVDQWMYDSKNIVKYLEGLFNQF